MSSSLQSKYRPKLWKEVIGQKEAVKIIRRRIKQGTFPQASLLSGPKGSGKTTIVRLIAAKLGVSNHDYRELNAADYRGIDSVRDLRDQMAHVPFRGSKRLWLIDECHQLTKDAQDAFLKPLEEPPNVEHYKAYFVFATTDPGKVSSTILSRLTEFRLVKLESTEMETLLQRVARIEGLTIYRRAILAIVEAADGDARCALKILDNIRVLDEKDQLRAIEKANDKAGAINLARALMYPKNSDKRARWKEVATIIKTLEDKPERIRHLVLSYASSILISGKADDRAYLVINAFRDPFYEVGSADKALLLAACYEVVVKP